MLLTRRITAGFLLSINSSYIQPAASLSLKMTSTSTSPQATPKIIDSHLHVWADPIESTTYPYAKGQEPPPNLSSKASMSELINNMNSAGIDGALIVQPINHKFDHSYVSHAIREHPEKFKGMLLHDPSLEPASAISRLEELVLQGFVGVRFNPYLWPDGKLMSEPDGAGSAVYERCAELQMPVGIMCFKGLELHYEDIVSLIRASPDTVCVLDHFGFTSLKEEKGACFEQLLSLSQYPNVCVKISALFRVCGSEEEFPYEGLRKKRFAPLLEAYGADRLMFGTDFPFVLEEAGGYVGTLDVIRLWTEKEDVEVREKILGGTAQRLFGFWGKE